MDNPLTNGDKRNPDGTFAPGYKGGPGRPKGSISIIGRLKKMWEDDPEDFEKYVQEIRKDKMMRREIVQQIDGKPVQPLSNANGEPFIINVVNYGNNDTPPVQS